MKPSHLFAAALSAAVAVSASAPGHAAPPTDGVTVDLDRPAEAEPDAGPWRLTIHSENDSNLYQPNSPSDRDYTAGNGFTLAWRPAFADDLARRLPDLGGGFGDAPDTAFGVQAAQLIFTPVRIELERPQPDERPFAGYLFVGGYLQRASDDTLDHVQLDVGVLGSGSGAEQAQKLIHDVFPASTEPNGWDNQVHDEPALQLTLRRKWRSDADAASFDLAGLPLQAQAIPGVELELGNATRQLEASILGRVGYRLPDDFGPGRIFEPASFTGDPRTGWSGYLFGRLTGRVVEHDLFLEGSDFRNPRHPTVSKEPFVGEAALGLAVGYRGEHWAVNLNYAQIYATQQYVEQDDAHSYGRYALSVQRRF